VLSTITPNTAISLVAFEQAATYKCVFIAEYSAAKSRSAVASAASVGVTTLLARLGKITTVTTVTAVTTVAGTNLIAADNTIQECDFAHTAGAARAAVATITTIAATANTIPTIATITTIATIATDGLIATNRAVSHDVISRAIESTTTTGDTVLTGASVGPVSSIAINMTTIDAIVTRETVGSVRAYGEVVDNGAVLNRSIRPAIDSPSVEGGIANHGAIGDRGRGLKQCPATARIPYGH
jgi:hypothetical protein